MLVEALALVFATFVFLLVLIKLKFNQNSDFWTKRGFPTVKSQLKFFDVVSGAKLPFELDRTYYEELGDEKFGGCVEMGVPVLLIKDLDLARTIYVKDFDSFFDRRDFAKSDPIFKESLFFLQSQPWKEMRNFLSPTFTSGKIKRMFHHMSTTGRLMVDYVSSPVHPKGNEGRILLVIPLMRKYAVEVIGTAVFGLQTNVFTDPEAVFFKWAMKTADFDVMRKLRFAAIQNLPKISEWLELKFIDNQTHEFLRRALADGLKLRQNSTEPRDDFVQLLVEAMRGDGSSNDPDELLSKLANPKQKLKLTENMAIGQCFLFFFAGLDTVSSFLALAAYELALNPDVQEKVYEETHRAMQSGDGQNLTYDLVNGMEYLEMVSSEILRLYPAVVRLERKCAQDYRIPETNMVIPKGTYVGIAAAGIHRDEKYYPNPNQFDPERFNAENKAQRHQYAHMPFGHGPRNCIGMRFAQIESKTALAYLVHNFKIKPAASTPVPLVYKVEVGGCRAPNDLELEFVPRK